MSIVAVADRDDAHHQACTAWFDHSTDKRLAIDTVVTLYHRDFRVVRPAHRDAFILVP